MTDIPDKYWNTKIRFPKALHEQLIKAAEERDVSVKYLVVRAVEEFLPRLIPVNEFKSNQTKE